MDHILAIIIFTIIVFILLVIVALLFRYTFVFRDEFGSYTARIWTYCSASECNGKGKQQLISKCLPNPRTGAGCIDGNGEQTYADKIYEERECTAICPSAQEIYASGECINGMRQVTKTCQATGYNGPQGCTPGTVTTFSELCPLETIDSWGANYPGLLFSELPGCDVGTEKNIYSFLAEGYTTEPLPCNGSNCPISDFYSCFDPKVYANGYQYISNCIKDNTVVVPSLCRLFPVEQVPAALQPYIYHPFYFKDDIRGYLSASGPNNVFYRQDRSQAILMYLIPRSSTRMIFLIGAFGNPYFMSFGDMILKPVSQQLGDGGMTTGLAPKYTVTLDGNYMIVDGYASGIIEIQPAEDGFEWISLTA